MEKIKLGDKNISTLAFADDMVVMAEKEKEMRSMIERF